ncbi:hypothetical protein B0H19DRAFT_1236237 [Mycena capillaripes]|nr:hypothetical protein B0H19DRAFT_1236237 [Mycena capillaripes]
MGTTTAIGAAWQVTSDAVVSTEVHSLYTAEVILQAIVTKVLLRELDAVVQDGTSSASLHSIERLLVLAGHFLGVTNTSIYRCYAIWKTSRFEVVAVPVLLAVATTAVGYVSMYHLHVTPTALSDLRPYYGFILATNVTVTGLTVGRIWYTSQGLQTLGHTKFLRRYKLAMALMLESAMVYLIGSSIIMLELAGAWSQTEFIALDVSFAIVAPLLNIIPALMIVRVTLGQQKNHSVESKILPLYHSSAIWDPGHCGYRSESIICDGAEVSNLHPCGIYWRLGYHRHSEFGHALDWQCFADIAQEHIGLMNELASQANVSLKALWGNPGKNGVSPLLSLSRIPISALGTSRSCMQSSTDTVRPVYEERLCLRRAWMREHAGRPIVCIIDYTEGNATYLDISFLEQERAGDIQ